MRKGVLDFFAIEHFEKLMQSYENGNIRESADFE